MRVVHYAPALAVLTLGLPLCGQDPEPKSEPKPPAFHVVGRVVTEDHQPLAEVQLRVGLDIDGEVVCTTGADGRFRIRLPDREPDTVRSRMPEFLTFQADGRLMARAMVGRRNQWGFQKRGVGTQDLGAVMLPKGMPIQCRVRKDRGRPLQGAVILADSALPSSPFAMLGGGDTTPDYFSRAVTDAKGAAVIYGRGHDGVSVVIAAEGYYRKQLRFHGPGMPLVVAMEAGGFVAGKVVDHEGKPVRAMLGMAAEVKPTILGGVFSTGLPSNSLTAADGTFRLNVDYRHRYRISVNRMEGPSLYQHQAKMSQILTGPHEDVLIQMDKPKGVEGGVAVHVVDAASSEPVEGFRAAAIWQSLSQIQDIYLESQFENAAIRAREKGKVLLPPPTRGQRTGVVMIKAAGYATKLIEDVEWDEDKPVRVDAKLDKELLVHGVVVDGKTGAPVAGAEVWAVRRHKQNAVQSPYPGLPQHPAVLTDSKGRFRLSGLGKGRHQVFARHADHPDLKPKTVKLSPESPLAALKLKMPRGFEFAGKIKGGQHRPGWRLKLVPRADRRGGFFAVSLGSTTPGHTAVIQQDGSFKFRGLEKGSYTAHLVVPRLFGQAIDAELEATVKVAEDKTDAEVDVSGALPGRIQGKLVVKGVPPPTGRLALTAHSTSQDIGGIDVFLAMDAWGLSGPSATIGRDGAFDLELAPGKYRLKVVDLGTGVTLWQSEEQVELEAGAASQQQLELELALVRVRLKPRTEGGTIAAAILAVQVEWPKPEQGVFSTVFVEGSSGAVGGPGVSLADDQREIDLYLPARETKLLVHTNAWSLGQGQQEGQPSPLGRHEFTPEVGKTNRIEIEVSPPPEIEDSQAKHPAAQVRRAVQIRKR
ncbi:MAG: MSCRAMM family protein [Planctomycetota bacterium]|jgi:hypothetical protein